MMMIAPVPLPSCSSIIGCVSYKYVCFLFGVVSAALFATRLILAIMLALEPCEQPPPAADDYYPTFGDEHEFAGHDEFDSSNVAALATSKSVGCQSHSEIFFRFVLVFVSGVVVVGHFAALITEDKLLIGMVMGSQWLNLTSELISKTKAALMLLGNLDLIFMLITLLFFTIELLTAVSFAAWMVRWSSPAKHSKSRRRGRPKLRDDDEEDEEEGQNGGMAPIRRTRTTELDDN